MSTEKLDYYKVLGVPREAGEKEIKDAFRRLAMKYHPDRNKEAGAEARFKEVAEAYAVLSDPAKRRDYDRSGFAGVADFSREDLFGGINFDDIFAGSEPGFGPAGGFGSFDLFDRLSRRAATGPVRGDNIKLDLWVSLARVASGGEEKLSFTRNTVCAVCGGNGAKSGTALHRCEACQGSGRKTIRQKKTRNMAEVLIQQIGVCPVCGGRGLIIDQACPACQGSGQGRIEENLMVTVPVGIEDGMTLRIAGRGEPSPEPGGPRGNLLVRVRCKPDARFVRDGADLWHNTTIGVPDAVLGTDLLIPTLDGSVTVKVAPGTQPESTLRLRGKGLPRFGTTGRGDLYLRLHVRIPEKLSKELRSLYERLRSLTPA